MDETTGELPDEELEELEGARAYYRALRAVQDAAPRIIKAGDKHFHNFKYAPEKVYEALLVPLFLEEGLVVELAGVGPPDDLETLTKNDQPQWMTTLECVFRVTHFSSGYTQTYRIQGRRLNDADKGVSQAISSASKSFFQYVCQVREDEDADEIEGFTGTLKGPSKPRGRSKGPRRQNPPVEQGPPPPSPGQPTMSLPQRLQLAKDDLKSFMRRSHLLMYHLEALAQTERELRDDYNEWSVDEWEKALSIAHKRPDAFERALLTMAKTYPTAEERLKLLHDLVSKTSPNAEESVQIASAHVSKWNDAVEYWIDVLMKRTKQTEAGV